MLRKCNSMKTSHACRQAEKHMPNMSPSVVWTYKCMILDHMIDRLVCAWRAGLIRSCLSVPLGDMTSLRVAFRNCGTSPPCYWDFGYKCTPFPSRAHPLVHIARKDAGKQLQCAETWSCRGSFSCGDSDKGGHIADVPVGLCSQEFRSSVFFISTVLGWMFFLLV